MRSPDLAKVADAQPSNPDKELAEPPPATDLEACPRCGEALKVIVWGQTNCPRCGLHFECC